MTYDVLNDYGTFSEGDTITGRVTLELEKATKITSLFIKAKGDANVHWPEDHGDSPNSYSAHRRLFKQKHFLIAKDSKDTKLPSGIHIFKFNIEMPSGSMPSSFKGCHGRIVYKLVAKLCRSWRTDRSVDKEICFGSKSVPNLDQLMYQQFGSRTKELGIFSKGYVQMDVTVDRKAFIPGDTVSVFAKINNSSSKDMKPKFSLIQDVVYHASGSTNREKNVIQKQVEDYIKPKTQKEFNCLLKIPFEITPTILNCDILSVEYRIKVYLDISFSSDPEVVFPVVIIPCGLSPAGVVGGPSNSDFPPPAAFAGPYPPSPHSSGSIYPATSSQCPACPALYANTSDMHPGHFAGGYHNPVPQQPNPYGSPLSSSSSSLSSSSSSVLHPPPLNVPVLHPPSPGLANLPFSSVPPTYNTCTYVPSSNNGPSPPSCFSAPLLPCPPTVPSGLTVHSAMTEDFLSESNDKPPSYELLFPSSDAK